ncbi:hypothetical protein I5F18_21250 [Bacillus halotolerans]|uniref:hypothetical protein n=1 Tax=Bacillus halotolerans TaxID=260554 RepID=UPI00192AD44F|nr:hypothetical protein [Bacillus halotolerans]MBL4974816.1 hypothetical protein [Bacillus halotolerans]
MPPEENEIDWKAWIVEVAVEYAVPLAAEYLSGRIRQHFSQNENNLELMFKNAVEEVCSRVAEIIDQAFLDQYLSDCRHVSNQIKIYGETHDRDIITNAQIESSRLASRLYDMGYKAAGGFYIASNMHLASLRALSEIDATYKNTLRGFTHDYIEKGINLNTQLNDKATYFTPSECEWGTTLVHMTGGGMSGEEILKYRERYKEVTGETDSEIPEYVNAGWYFLKRNGDSLPYEGGGGGQPILEIDNERRERSLQACTRARQSIIDEKVNPIITITNSTENVLNNWRNWRIE